MSFTLRQTYVRVATAALFLAAVLGAAGAAGAQGVPGVDKNKCLAGKNKCVANKLAGLMKCREQCEQKPDKCGQVQTDCEAKVIEKFDGGAKPGKGCFAKLEAKQDPEKPETICKTIGDTAPMEAQVDAAVGDLVGKLEGAVPAAWTCDPDFYYEGPAFLCNCGCGARDPDCADATAAACSYCDNVGACSAADDCSQIDPADNSRCRPYQCGDGIVESPESCDGTNLGGATCASLGFGSGTLACTAGCGYDVSGCSSCGLPGVRFKDRGLTVFDCDTGLEWEKKTTAVLSGQNFADPHDVDNRYTWTASEEPYPPDGTAFTDFLVKLNTPPCFAGHCDWRLPSEEGRNPPGTGAIELESILLAPCCTNPCIDPIFGPTAANYYWSSTTRAISPDNAWDVLFVFDVGGVHADYKFDSLYVRAVRGGS